MNNFNIEVNIFRKLLVAFFAFTVAISQSDILLPKVEILIFSITLLMLFLSKVHKKIIFSITFLVLLLCFLWRIASYIRSPFMGDISVLSIPLSTISAIILCFFLIPTLFKNGADFFIYYKKILILILVFMWLIHFFIPDSLSAAGSDKGVSLGFWHPNVLGLYLVSLIFLSIVEIILIKKYLFNFFYIFTCTYFLFQTNSRGAYILFGLIFFSILLYMFFTSALMKKIFSNRYFFFLGFFLICFFIKKWYESVGFIVVDQLSSGRLSILDTAISDVGDNYMVGLGILPRSFMYGFDYEKYGAGLDGSYSVVFYNEGLIGLFLFILFHLFLVFNGFKIKEFKHKFIYFSAIFIFLLHALFEAHYWQRVSPSTVIIFSLAALCLKNGKENL